MPTRVVLASVVENGQYQVGGVEKYCQLPCGRGVTGFWSRNPAHTANLLSAIEADMEYQLGGGVWPRELVVLIAEEGDLTISEPPASDLHVEDFDGSEIFASEVKQYTWMYWQDWLAKFTG